MSKKLLVSIAFALIPGLAFAQGSGTDRDRVTREIELMQRDGRWERLRAEGQANREAFERLRQADQGEQLSQPPTAYGSIRPRRRR